MGHYLMVIMVVIALGVIDGISITRKRLRKELYAFIAFAAIIVIYGYFYFSTNFNASIADILNQIIVNK